MKIRQAIRILKRERESLGLSWEDLFILCRTESSALEMAALDAYDAYEKHWEDHRFLQNLMEEE